MTPPSEDPMSARLAQDATDEANVLKFLFVGMPGSGKSTLAWQTKLWSSPEMVSEEADAAMIALCMARHRRLGAHSPAHALPPEIMANIRRFLEHIPPKPRGMVLQHDLKLGPGMRGRPCRLLDVNGSYDSQMRKWIHCFDNVSAVIFVVDLSAYDQKLEQGGDWYMDESVLFWEHLAMLQCLQKAQLFLFLNKRDVFEEKLKRTGGLGAWQPAAGLGADYNTCIRHIQEAHLTRLRCASWMREAFVHATCAIDARNVEFVMESVADVMLKRGLRRMRTP